MRLVSCLATLSLIAIGQPAPALDFTTYDQFPAPAPFAFVVSGASLPDGTLLVWNGDTVYRQKFPDVDRFTALASGYPGDTGFVAITSDANTAILGSGFGGDIYSLDLADPQNFSPASIIANEPHFSGALLTDDLLLLDASTADFSATQLLIVSLSGKKSSDVPVVSKSAKYNLPKELIVEKPPFSFSSLLHYDAANSIVYAMDGNTRELRYFAVQDLIDAFNNTLTLDWETDGVLVGAAGMFFGNGVSGITPAGNLVIGGSEGFLQPGGIQLVDPRLDDPSQAAILDSYDPAGNQGFYSVIYNPETDVITAIESGVVFASVAGFAPVPAVGTVGLATLGTALAMLAARQKR